MSDAEPSRPDADYWDAYWRARNEAVSQEEAGIRAKTERLVAAGLDVGEPAVLSLTASRRPAAWKAFPLCSAPTACRTLFCLSVAESVM